jgi:hypothetical protein
MNSVGLWRNDAHEYWWADEAGTFGPLLSVTTVLKDAIAKPALLNWMAKVTAEFAVDKAELIADMRRSSNVNDTVRWVTSEARRTRDAAASVGTDVHAYCDAIARGEKPDVPPPYQPYLNAFRAWLDATGPRIVTSEQMGVNLTLGYAGTFDLIYELDGKRWLVDIKTSTGVYAETAGQLAAYSKFEWLGKPDDATRYPMPVCSKFAVLHLRPGVCRLVEMRPTTQTWDMFKGALAVSRWVHDEAKTVITGGKAA